MVKATIKTGVAMKVIPSRQANYLNIDTTLQTKAIRYPTDRPRVRPGAGAPGRARAEGRAVD
jgi:hypothetical protein